MVQKIIWTREALSNLEEIQSYISKDSLFYAERTVYIIYKAVEKLRSFPEIGMVVPYVSKYVIRRILIKSFKVLYCYHDNSVYIVAVYRQSRQLPADFDFVTTYF